MVLVARCSVVVEVVLVVRSSDAVTGVTGVVATDDETGAIVDDETGAVVVVAVLVVAASVTPDVVAEVTEVTVTVTVAEVTVTVVEVAEVTGAETPPPDAAAPSTAAPSGRSGGSVGTVGSSVMLTGPVQAPSESERMPPSVVACPVAASATRQRADAATPMRTARAAPRARDRRRAGMASGARSAAQPVMVSETPVTRAALGRVRDSAPRLIEMPPPEPTTPLCCTSTVPPAPSNAIW